MAVHKDWERGTCQDIDGYNNFYFGKTITFKNPNWHSSIGEVTCIRVSLLQITVIKVVLSMKQNNYLKVLENDQKQVETEGESALGRGKLH